MLSATARQYYLFGTRAIWYPYGNYCVYNPYLTDDTDTDTAVILIRDILCEHRGCITAIHAMHIPAAAPIRCTPTIYVPYPKNHLYNSLILSKTPKCSIRIQSVYRQKPAGLEFPFTG